MAKATHTGECQCCGARQKLPGDRLAKHGYTVRQRGQWGWFEGVCDGSDELPLEVSKDLIETYIANTQARRDALLVTIRDLRQPATEPKGWRNCFHSGGPGQRSYYAWHMVTVDLGGDGSLKVGGFNRLGEEITEDAYRSGINYEFLKDPIALATSMNARYAKHLEDGSLRQMENYITWQQGRIKGWKPKPCTPVK